MKLIITGSCGHIGSYLAEKIYLIPKIKEVILIDNLSSNRYVSLFNLNKKTNYKFFQIDLSKKKSLEKFKDVSYLIHCASMTNAEKSFSVEKEMFRNNLDCMKNVIDYCVRNKVKLIHLSSTSVYGKQAEIVDEKCEKKYLKPQSPYAKIKLIEENMLKKNNKIQYNTFRLGTIAGYSKGMRFHTAVNKFCWQATLKQPISVWETAYDQYRPYLDISDATTLIYYIIGKKLFNNETYNAVTTNATVRDIVNIVSNEVSDVKIEFVKSKIMNQLSYHVVANRIQELGFKFRGNLTKGVQETMQQLQGIRSKLPVKVIIK